MNIRLSSLDFGYILSQRLKSTVIVDCACMYYNPAPY